MFGGPGESEQTVRETVRFMEQALAPRDRIMCTIGVRIYPDTGLERIAREEGVLGPNADLSDLTFYFSPHISPARVLQLLEGCARRSQTVYLETLQRPLVRWTLRLHAALRLPGPQWRAVPFYNLFARWELADRRRRAARISAARDPD